jgi:hypothetical protein
MKGRGMSPDTIESTFIGLTLAVLAILASAVMTHLGSAWRWLRYGFAAGEMDGRKAACVFVFGGLLLYGGFQLFSRSRVIPIPAIYLQIIGLIGWSLFGYGAVVWQASIMAAGKPEARRAARVYIWGMVLVALACAVAVGYLRPFHSVVVARAPHHCEAP